MSLFLLYKVVRDTLQVLSFHPKVSSQQADPHVGSATDFTPDVLPDTTLSWVRGWSALTCDHLRLSVHLLPTSIVRSQDQCVNYYRCPALTVYIKRVYYLFIFVKL